jgi:hypothetical protein
LPVRDFSIFEQSRGYGNRRLTDGGYYSARCGRFAMAGKMLEPLTPEVATGQRVGNGRHSWTKEGEATARAIQRRVDLDLLYIIIINCPRPLRPQRSEAVPIGFAGSGFRSPRDVRDGGRRPIIFLQPDERGVGQRCQRDRQDDAESVQHLTVCEDEQPRLKRIVYGT